MLLVLAVYTIVLVTVMIDVSFTVKIVSTDVANVLTVGMVVGELRLAPDARGCAPALFSVWAVDEVVVSTLVADSAV